MTCPEERLVAFLAGELSAGEEREFDQHLLECESCWREVQADRVGRLVLERLQVPAPTGLRDRVSFAVSLEQPGAASHRRRISPHPVHRRGAVALVAALSVVLAAGGILAGLLIGATPTDPPQVAAVVAMVMLDGHPSVALLAGEHRVINHQQMTVRAYMVHGKEAIVATSMRPLPMPASSDLTASSPRAWMATDGNLALYGVNRSVGQSSMFLVAAMPMAALPQVAVQLHLI